MTAPAFEQRAVPAAQHLVYTRRNVVAAYPINGELDGWELDPNLRCERITMTDGPHAAVAELTFVPHDNSQFRVEHALNQYTTDDQVKIVMLKLDSELIQQPAEADEGVVLFEGVLMRCKWGIQTSDKQSDESVIFIAFAFPLLDDLHTDHLITGRWMFDREDETVASDNQPFIVWSPSLPAVFNHGGRPNMGLMRIGGGIITGEVTAAPVFTHDDDPAGRFWTVRAAIASIILQWIYGPQLRVEPDGTEHTILNYTQLSRHICIDRQLMAELGRAHDATGLLDYHADLGKRIPEVSVHGLGPLSAIEAVCKAAGFMMGLEPVQDASLNPNDGIDRRYRLRVWHRNHGPAKTVSLLPAGSAPVLPEYLYRDNNIHGVQAVEDAKEIVNECLAVGESYIEGAIILKPAWALAEVDDAAVVRSHQDDNEKLKAGTGYHAKHLPQGALFDQYKHVGRLWVADCIGDPFGGAGTDVGGYTSGVYKHEDQGFDFCEALGLQETGNGVDQELASAGFTENIRWSNRLRRPMPLRSPDAQGYGRDFYLEVSENAGSTWQRLDGKHFRTLREYFGILLTGINNLAAVNAASLATGKKCEVSASWWALIKSEQLLFRLTSAIKSDHGVRAFAKMQIFSGSHYRRGQLIVARGSEEVWQAPGSPVNPSSGVHRKVLGWGGQGAADLGATVKHANRTLMDIAELRRSAFESRRGSYVFSAYIWTYGDYQIGDAITKIKGREIFLSTNTGEAKTYPTVVAIEITLSPSGQQGIKLTCEDHVLRGRGGGR